MRNLAIGTKVAIVAVLSATLLLGPVAAGYANDTGKIIAGLLAAGLIYWAVDKSDDTPTSRAYDPYEDTYGYGRDEGWRDGDWERADTWDRQWQWGDRDGWDKPQPEPVRAWNDRPQVQFTVTEQDAQYFIAVQVYQWERRNPFDGNEKWLRERDKYAGKVAKGVHKFLRGESNPPAGFAQVIGYGRAHGYAAPPGRPQPNLEPPSKW